MKKKKYLPLYYKWLKSGHIPYSENKQTAGGLCSIFGRDEYFNMINPENGHGWYWGHNDGTDWAYDVEIGFTPTRQNVVLLMACLAGEL